MPQSLFWNSDLSVLSPLDTDGTSVAEEVSLLVTNSMLNFTAGVVQKSIVISDKILPVSAIMA